MKTCHHYTYRTHGAYLACECVTCHQPSGASDGIPAIVGWPVPEFVHALLTYREGIRENPVMKTVVGRLADEEIAALAAYFETVGD